MYITYVAIYICSFQDTNTCFEFSQSYVYAYIVVICITYKFKDVLYVCIYTSFFNLVHIACELHHTYVSKFLF